MMNKWLIGAAPVALAALAVTGGVERAAAAVVNAAANGFEVRETVHIAAAPDKVYSELLVPAHWWNSAHSFSGNAANLSLDARVGGCWCENLPGGGAVEHMRVVYMAPGKVLRLRGALGPFQAFAADGVMTWSVKSAADGSDVTLTYALGGYFKDGTDELSKAADGVLGEQIERLKKSIEGTAAGDATRPR
jgi:Polyketide cyclase / dehydrase and lipid transport